MKIGRYFLAALLMAAVVVPVSAQDKEYDVKLTVYPKEEVAKESKKEKKQKERNLRDEYREYKKDQNDARRNEAAVRRTAGTGHPGIEPAQTGRPYSPARPEVATDACCADNSQNDPAQATAVVYDGDPVKIQPAHVAHPAAPVRPQESYEPVAGKCKEACGKECCAEKKCSERGDKPCCGEQKCEQGGKPCCGEQMNGRGHGMPRGQAHKLNGAAATPCGMPIFGSNAQYRDFKKMMRRGCCEDFIGDRFYLGTNTLAYLILSPNISMEWRRDEARGFRLEVGGSFGPSLFGTGDTNRAGGFWIAPEYRFYLGERKAWYAGPMVKFGYVGRNYDDYYYYNYYGTDSFHEYTVRISAGGSFGYMHKLRPNFALDYNLSVGMSAVGYNDGYSGTDWYAAMSVTRVGISLVWKTCSKPLKHPRK